MGPDCHADAAGTVGPRCPAVSPRRDCWLIAGASMLGRVCWGECDLIRTRNRCVGRVAGRVPATRRSQFGVGASDTAGRLRAVGVPRPHRQIRQCISALDLGGSNASATDYGTALGGLDQLGVRRCLADAAVAVRADDGAKVAARDDAVVCVRWTREGGDVLPWLTPRALPAHLGAGVDIVVGGGW
jgi:hypothetical protein